MFVKAINVKEYMEVKYCSWNEAILHKNNKKQKFPQKPPGDDLVNTNSSRLAL
jgi:hypothetical protein